MNKVALLGRLTRDPELKKTQDNNIYSNVTIAVNRKYSKGEGVKADFIPVVVWGKQAEFLARFTQKGSRVLISGRIHTRSREDSERKRIIVTEVIAEDVYLADNIKDQESQGYYVNEADSEIEGFRLIEIGELPF